MTSLVPIPDAMPVAREYFQFLLMLVFPLHLMLMNAMLGSTVVILYAGWRRDAVLRRLAHELAKALPFLVAFTVNLGVAALLFLQVLYGHLFYTSSILMAVFWLAVIPMLLVAYFAVYYYDFRFPELPRVAMILPALALLIFLCIAFIYTNNMTLMLDPQKWDAYFHNSSGTILNLGMAALVPRYLHFMVGGMAIGGLFVALFGRLKRKLEPEVRVAAENIGLGMFVYLTLFQVVDGIWFLVSLPQEIMFLFLGKDVAGTLLFLFGMLCVLFVLVAAIKKKLYLSAVLVVPLVLIMVSIRGFVRDGYLKPHFSTESLQVIPQYSPMVFFFAVLAVGLLTIFWLVKQAARALQQPGTKE
jgi:hypothetical protein